MTKLGASQHPDGSATIAGLFSDTASFGDISLTVNGEFDAFVAQISSDGTVNWARNFGGAYRNVGFEFLLLVIMARFS